MKIVYNGIRNPFRGTAQSAGLDLFAETLRINKDTNQVTFDTCVAVQIPEGHFGLLAPRSSMSNTNFRLSNSLGIVDADFLGTIKARFDYVGNGDIVEEATALLGTRIVQLIIIPCVIPTLEYVSALEMTERADGGFGSTGQT